MTLSDGGGNDRQETWSRLFTPDYLLASSIIGGRVKGAMEPTDR